MLKVFGTSVSGNCYKVKLLLEQLGKKYQWVEVNSLKGETRTPEFLAINANGRVPVLQIESGQFLPESNAILCYLADGTEFWPADRLEKAETLQWMFFEQYSHEPYVAVARLVNYFLPPDHPRKAELPRLHERSYQALDVMEKHLSGRRYFVGQRYSIADIALFAYTHVAEDGGLKLAKYTAINTWLDRVKAQARFVPLPLE